MLRYAGIALPYRPSTGRGGTQAYAHYYHAVAKPFNIAVPYPEGTLFIRDFRDEHDQGHVAVLLREKKVLQSFCWPPNPAGLPGINDDQTLQESHAMHFYEYAVLPDDWLVGK